MADPTLLEGLFLGALQGATEWLPVSSSGHLALAQNYLGLSVPVFFDLVLHAGTLLVVTLFLRKEIWRIIKAFVAAPKATAEGKGARAVWWGDRDRRLGVLVVAGSIPTAAIGFLFERQFESAFETPLLIGAGLMATGAFLLLLRWAPAKRGDGVPGLADAVLVGIAQGASVAPGVSRSGSTIGTALLRGVDRETAARLSFLLSIPAIAGATALKASGEGLDAATHLWPVYTAGFVAAAVVGWACLWLLVRVVRDAKMHLFAPYCLALGAVVVAVASGWIG